MLKTNIKKVLPPFLYTKLFLDCGSLFFLNLKRLGADTSLFWSYKPTVSIMVHVRIGRLHNIIIKIIL